MNSIKIVIGLLVILFLFMGYISWFLNFNLPYTSNKSEIDSLHAINDNLQKSINNNTLIIDSLNDINTDLKNQVTQDKQQLIQINNQAKFYEKKYNDEKNRVNNMSNTDIVKEFISVFSN